MKSVLFSINKPHTDRIRLSLKKIELRTKPPKIDGVYKGVIYETKKYGGSGKVIGEFTAYNENTYRVCMGVPAHLALESWVSTADILKYSDNGKKDITAISILEGQKRKKFFEENPPKTVYVSSSRLQCAKNGDFEKYGKGVRTAIAYAWFVWEKGYRGETIVKWIN